MDISRDLKNIILSNPELIKIINYFLLKETTNYIYSFSGLIVTGFTISYIIGGLIINHKIKKNKVRAKCLYRKLIRENNILYRDLVKCSFYGGEEYENLFLNNKQTLEIILKKESNLKIPDTSLKTKFLLWAKNLTR